MIKNKKILVTGGIGFLGTNLCKLLLENGNEVVALDNLYTALLSNVDMLKAYPLFSFINHDVTQSFDIQADYIVNLACPASPPHYQRDPIFTTKTSVLGALNVLELARKYNATVLQASTSEVYGDPEVSPQSEEYRGNVNPIGIRSCYDEGKRCAESLFFDYQRMYGVKIKVVRIFNTYGPFMDPLDGRVVSNFIIQALQGEKLTLYGDGKQTRSFCFVDDLVDGIVRMLESNDRILGPINLGNPKEFTLLELIQKIENVMGAPLQVVYKNLPADDPRQRCPDITKAQAQLEWNPVTPLHDGLVKTVNYFQGLLGTTYAYNTCIKMAPTLNKNEA